jgi:hypothetical protein
MAVIGIMPVQSLDSASESETNMDVFLFRNLAKTATNAKFTSRHLTALDLLKVE